MRRATKIALTTVGSVLGAGAAVLLGGVRWDRRTALVVNTVRAARSAQRHDKAAITTLWPTLLAGCSH